MKRNFLVISIFVCLILLQNNTLVSSIEPPPGNETYHMYGYVGFDGPISGATVKFYVDGAYKGSFVTGSNGGFSKYVLAPEWALNFKVTITKTGFVTKSVTKEASGTNVNYGTINLSIIYSISGTVIDSQTEQGIEGAIVDLYHGSIWIGWTWFKQVTTGTGGSFSTQYTRSSSISGCKAEASAVGYGIDGEKIVGVTGPVIALGDVEMSHTQNPEATAQITSIYEKSATLEWTIIDWGSDGWGTNAKVEIKYMRGTSGSEWDVIEEPIYFTEYQDDHELEGLVMDTTYKWDITIKHTVSGNEITVATFDGSFTTLDWAPTKKYAIILNLNKDPSEPTSYLAHQNSHDDMSDFLHSGDTPPPPEFENHVIVPTYPDWHYDAIWEPTSSYNLHDGDDLADELTHFVSQTDSNTFLFIYIVGHGGENTICVYDGASHISVSENVVAAAINTYSGSHKPGKMAIVIESCHSGSLIDALRGEDRVVITSSHADCESGIGNGVCWFSDRFISESEQAGSLYTAFYNAAYDIFDQGLVVGQNDPVYQDPQLCDWLDASNYGSSYGDIAYRIGYNGQLAFVLGIMIPLAAS